MTRASEIVGWQVWRRIGADAKQVRNYARTAETWEALRKRIDAGEALPSDAEKYRELTDMMNALVAALGLTSEKRWHLVPTVATDDAGEALAGVTDRNGYLIGDPARIIGAGWRYAAELWHG